jgi:hypothetical protein
VALSIDATIGQASPVSVEPPELNPAAARSLLRVLREAERKVVEAGREEAVLRGPDALAS